MLPKNRLGRQQIKKLHVVAGAEHPHAAQMPVNWPSANARPGRGCLPRSRACGEEPDGDNASRGGRTRPRKAGRRRGGTPARSAGPRSSAKKRPPRNRQPRSNGGVRREEVDRVEARSQEDLRQEADGEEARSQEDDGEEARGEEAAKTEE